MADRLSRLIQVLPTVLPQFEREDGQDMIEYALLGALVSVVAVLIIVAIGPFLDNYFNAVLNAFQHT